MASECPSRFISGAAFTSELADLLGPGQNLTKIFLGVKMREDKLEFPFSRRNILGNIYDYPSGSITIIIMSPCK